MTSRVAWMRVLRPIVGRFPQIFYRVALVVGWVAWQVRPGMRRNVVRNLLPLCDGDRRRARREGLRACQFVAQYWVDLMSLPRRDMASFEADHLRLVHGERLAVLEQPGPIVAVSAHTGNGELAVQALTFRGRSFLALVEAQEPPEWSEMLLQMRAAAGGNFHETDFGGVRACVEALHDGQLVGMMGDRDIQLSGICVTLCGRRVRIPRGPWELARRTGALVLPVFSTRVSGDTFAVHVEEAFLVPKTRDVDSDVLEGAKRYAVLLEEHLRRDPGQWAVLEDFWRVHACD